MARVLRLELATLIVLGFIIGAILFLYVNIKRELSAVQNENSMLHQKMEESLSNSRANIYKRDLIQSDLQQLRKQKVRDEKIISELDQQIQDLRQHLDNATKELKALQKAHTQVLSEKSELQGVQEQLITDVEEAREKEKECEKKKSSAIKTAAAASKKKIKAAEDLNLKLTQDVEALRARIQENCPTISSSLKTSPVT